MRKTGIMVIGTIGIIIGILTLLSHMYDMYAFYKGSYILVRSPVWHFFLRKLIGAILSLGFIWSSIYVLKLKNWARRLFIFLTLLDCFSVFVQFIIITAIMPYGKYPILRAIGRYVLDFSSSLHLTTNYSAYFFLYIPEDYLGIVLWSQVFLSIGLIISFLFYLTRPKVKELFTQGINK